jgi:hypothetical protein
MKTRFTRRLTPTELENHIGAGRAVQCLAQLRAMDLLAEARATGHVTIRTGKVVPAAVRRTTESKAQGK